MAPTSEDDDKPRGVTRRRTAPDLPRRPNIVFTSVRRQLGGINVVYRTPEDSNDVLVVHDFDDEAQATDFLADPELAEAKQSLGVAGEPHIQLFLIA